MNYKMITIDLDDTLLTDELTVTDTSKRAIRQAVDQGVIVTLATGRMFASAAKIASQLQLNVPLITYQGAYVKGLYDKSTLYEKSVSPGISQEVYNVAQQYGVHMQIYQEDTLISPEDNDKIKHYVQIANVPYVVREDFEELLARPSTKILYSDDPDKLDHLQDLLKKRLGNAAYITKSKPFFLEILHPEASKGKAILYLAEHFGIDPKQIIAVGDSYNDHDMLEVAGLSVAMGNAVESLKEIADYITATNNEDGVRQVIEKFILKAS